MYLLVNQVSLFLFHTMLSASGHDDVIMSNNSRLMAQSLFLEAG